MWRSLAARLLWEQEVRGSNPRIPTTTNPRSLDPGFIGIRLVQQAEQAAAREQLKPLTYSMSVVILLRWTNYATPIRLSSSAPQKSSTK